MDFSPEAFLDLKETDHSSLFEGIGNVWEVLPKIGDYASARVAAAGSDRLLGTIHPRAEIGEHVFIAEGATIEANAVIKGPAWIGTGTTIRSGAYLRENLVIGDHCTLGNSSEFKNCILFNRCEVPHFNYVGDSVLGFKVHLGAGVICSNVRLDRTGVKLMLPEGGGQLDTGLRKFGAIVGDYTELGCNACLSPGSILGRNCIVYPLTSWTGILDHHQIVKHRPDLRVVPRR